MRNEWLTIEKKVGESVLTKCSEYVEGKIVIPDGVTIIDDGAFSGCSNLTSITIAKSVRSIGWSGDVRSVFKGCSNLTSINVAYDNAIYDSRNDCNAIIETETDTLIVGCKNTIIPNSVSNVNCFAFSGCSGLTTISIPDSVVIICGHAFSDCQSLTSITIPDSVKTISDGAFSGCSALESITIPKNINRIGKEAFLGCTNLSSIIIPEGMVAIGDRTFKGCSGLKTVTIPNSVTYIGDGAFSGCSRLESINIPDSVTAISPNAFEGCPCLPKLEIAKLTQNFNINYVFFIDPIYVEPEAWAPLLSCLKIKSVYSFIPVNELSSELYRNIKPYLRASYSNQDYKSFCDSCAYWIRAHFEKQIRLMDDDGGNLLKIKSRLAYDNIKNLDDNNALILLHMESTYDYEGYIQPPISCVDCLRETNLATHVSKYCLNILRKKYGHKLFDNQSAFICIDKYFYCSYSFVPRYMKWERSNFIKIIKRGLNCMYPESFSLFKIDGQMIITALLTDEGSDELRKFIGKATERNNDYLRRRRLLFDSGVWDRDD